MPLCSIGEKKSHGCDEMKCRKSLRLEAEVQILVGTIESRLSEVQEASRWFTRTQPKFT